MEVLLVKAGAYAAALDRICTAIGIAGGRVTLADGPASLPGLPPNGWDIVAGPGSMPCSEAFLARHSSVRTVVAFGSGVDGIDLEAATRRGIVVGHGATPENARGMASATVMLMLAALHRLPSHQTALREGTRPLSAQSLHGLTVGLVGFGRIAREVARLLEPWSVRLLIHTPRPMPDSGPSGAVWCGLDQLVAEADVVSLHAALTAQTRNLLDAGRLRTMKRGAVVINVARGGMVDEAALTTALAEGRLHAAALDVFAVEPLPGDSGLRQAPNLILTPHSIGQTSVGHESLVDAMIANVTSVIAGNLPPFLANPDAVAAWLARAPRPGVSPGQRTDDVISQGDT